MLYTVSTITLHIITIRLYLYYFLLQLSGAIFLKFNLLRAILRGYESKNLITGNDVTMLSANGNKFET